MGRRRISRCWSQDHKCLTFHKVVGNGQGTRQFRTGIIGGSMSNQGEIGWFYNQHGIFFLLQRVLSRRASLKIGILPSRFGQFRLGSHTIPRLSIPGNLAASPTLAAAKEIGRSPPSKVILISIGDSASIGFRQGWNWYTARDLSLGHNALNWSSLGTEGNLRGDICILKLMNHNETTDTLGIQWASCFHQVSSRIQEQFYSLRRFSWNGHMDPMHGRNHGIRSPTLFIFRSGGCIVKIIFL